MAKNKVGVHGTDAERNVKQGTAEEKGTAPGRKTECPLTEQVFLAEAKPLNVKMGESSVIVSPKKFASGSFGFHGQEKVVVVIDGTPVKLQVNIIATAIGSKPTGTAAE